MPVWSPSAKISTKVKVDFRKTARLFPFGDMPKYEYTFAALRVSN